jgi:thioesterase domain-containing protein/acyl carrier protein
VAIRGLDGAICADGEIGDIVVRGMGVSPGNIDDLNVGSHTNSNVARARVAWLSTGDLGRIDSGDFLTIVGRTKEIINRGGEKVSPYEVEKALLLHASVREAAAFGIAHPRLGENVAAAVTLKPGFDATSSDLRSFLYKHLKRSMIPQHVFVIDAMPRGSTGKISRSETAAKVARLETNVAYPETLLERQIAEIWQRMIGRSDIGVDENFFEAGGDSLLATQMLLELETTLQRQLPQSELREAYTIRQLAVAVMRTMPANDDLISCARHGSKAPFFYCHGDHYARGFYALRLADQLGDDQPVYLIHPLRNSGSSGEMSIEAFARSYVPQLLAIHPTGSFRLGGHCNGGLLAWEIAHQLSKAGRQVEMVVLIDTTSFNAHLPLRLVKRALSLVAYGLPSNVAAKVRQNAMRRVWDWVTKAMADERGLVRLALTKIRNDILCDRQASRGPAREVTLGDDVRVVSNYLPPRISTDLCALVCTQNWGSPKYSPLAWSRLARAVHVKEIPGGHNSCVSTHAADVAAVLASVLSADRQPEADERHRSWGGRAGADPARSKA